MKPRSCEVIEQLHRTIVQRLGGERKQAAQGVPWGATITMASYRLLGSSDVDANRRSKDASRITCGFMITSVVRVRRQVTGSDMVHDLLISQKRHGYRTVELIRDTLRSISLVGSRGYPQPCRKTGGAMLQPWS